MAWRIDVLGYTRVDYYTNRPVKQLNMGGLEVLAAKMTLASAKDDEVPQNMQSWSHRLWGVETSMM